MKIRTLLFSIFLLGLASEISAQQFAVDQNAIMISGTGSFMTQGGDIFVDSGGNEQRIFSLTSEVNYFIARHLFIGGAIDFSRNSQGDYKSSGIGIGPRIGIAMGGLKDNVYPYISFGMKYYEMNANYGSGSDVRYSGSDMAFGVGVIVPLKPNIGLVFEGGYSILDLKNSDSGKKFQGNILSVGIGIAGLIYDSLE